MKSLLVACAVLLGGCSPLPASAPDVPAKVASAQDLRSKTVALAEADEDSVGGARAYCTGVWISDTTILTAYHCMDGGESGAKVSYTVDSDVFEAGGVRVRRVVKLRDAELWDYDQSHDLAMLRASLEGLPESHGVARVAARDPVAGDFAQELGQSLGLWWSYSSGDVAAVRALDIGDEYQANMLWVQTTAPTSPGNSGGGLYNSRGELIGICHGGFPRGQNMNIFVHPTYLRSFLWQPRQ